MSELIFREAVAADLPGIVGLLADDELGRNRDDPTKPLSSKYIEAFAALNADPNQCLVVVEESGQLLGCLQLTFVPGLSRLGMLRGQLESVRVAADHRGRGIGRQLVQWGIAECRERGCGLVQLTTDKTRHNTVEFYASLGFEASHEGLKLML